MAQQPHVVIALPSGHHHLATKDLTPVWRWRQCLRS